MNRNHRVATGSTAGVSEAMAQLLVWFERRGYIRRYDPQRRAREGQGYKKGYEVRFVLDSEAALQEVRRLLTAAKLRPGKPFRKYHHFVQPVYGRATMEWFVERVSKGRERAKRGFGPDGRRILRRSRPSEQSPVRERLPNSALPPPLRPRPPAGSSARKRRSPRRD